jgi:hypothetical protein
MVRYYEQKGVVITYKLSRAVIWSFLLPLAHVLGGEASCLLLPHNLSFCLLLGRTFPEFMHVNFFFG